MIRAWIWTLTLLVAASGAACSTKHRAPGPLPGVCLDDPAKLEEEPAANQELTENEAAPADAEECAADAMAEQQVAER